MPRGTFLRGENSAYKGLTPDRRVYKVRSLLRPLSCALCEYCHVLPSYYDASSMIKGFRQPPRRLESIYAVEPLYRNAGKISRVQRGVPDKRIAVFNINVTPVPSIRNYCTLKTVSQIFFIELPRFTEERTEKSWGETEGKTQCLD